jgi:hypothetical protein|tara:strand:- start:188 stop:445 length:258 start_codon:yes stop_codon:yes gene_type:complete
MYTLITHKQFIKMRDSGKFSKKFEGRHSYFLYLDPEIEKKTLEVYKKNEDYLSPPPAPRYRTDSFSDKYFNKNNLPNKYHINQNK